MKNIVEMSISLILLLLLMGCTTGETQELDESTELPEDKEGAEPHEHEETATTPNPLMPETTNEGEVQSILMTAKKWEFSPDTITVKKGDTVRLVIKSVDVEHGIELLDFNVDTFLAAGATETVEFVADKAGTFTFSCNVFCGTGHGGMRGTLIVEE